MVFVEAVTPNETSTSENERGCDRISNCSVGHRRATTPGRSAKKKRAKWAKSRAVTVEPLPPPPPPPPQEGDNIFFYSENRKLKRSSSSPSLSTSRHHETDLCSDKGRTNDILDCNIIEVQSSVFVPDSNKKRPRDLENDTQKREAKNTAKFLNEKSSSCNKEATLKSKSNLAEEKQGPEQKDGDSFHRSDLMCREKELQSRQDLIKIEPFRNDNKLLLSYVNKSTQKVRADICRDNSNNRCQARNSVERSSCDKASRAVLEQLDRKKIQNSRPTSLFKPGQPKIFYPDHRVSVPNTGALKRLAELHAQSERMITNSQHMESNRRPRRKRRPLPATPQDFQNNVKVEYRDVGVMTPDDLDTDSMASTDPCTSLSAAPLTLQSTYSGYPGEKGQIPKSVDRGKVSRKCKILLLIPTLIAIATTVVLLLFLLGVVGTPRLYEYDSKNHVTPGLLDWTTSFSFDEEKNKTFQTDVTSKVTSNDDFKFEMSFENDDEVIAATQSMLDDVTNSAILQSDERTRLVTSLMKDAAENKSKRRNNKNKQNVISTPSARDAEATTNVMSTLVAAETREAKSSPSPSMTSVRTRQSKKRRNRKGRRHRKNRLKSADHNNKRQTRNLRLKDHVERLRHRSTFTNNPDHVTKPSATSDFILAPETSTNPEVMMIDRAAMTRWGEAKGAEEQVQRLSIIPEDNEGDERSRFKKHRWDVENNRSKATASLSVASQTRKEVLNKEETSVGEICEKIIDPVCDAILPYSMTSRNRDVSLTQSEVMSQILNSLKKDMELSDRRMSKKSMQCDAESASRFLCAVQHPKCEDSSVLPCQDWCMDVLFSCMSSSSLASLNSLLNLHRIHDDLDSIASPVSEEDDKYLNENTQFRDFDNELANDVISYTCNLILPHSVVMRSLQCFNLSRMSSNIGKEVFLQFAPTDQTPSCGSEGFLCLSGICIDNKWLCDGNNDCGEWEDERGCDCGYGEFLCSTGQCIRLSQVCDGFYDCFDRSDETDCEKCKANMTHCGDRQCILSAWWCDGDLDCTNGQDEANCSCQSKGRFSCDGGECIPQHFICDGDFDCVDGADERNCRDVSKKTCDQWEMTCDHSCISVAKRCDGILDCSNSEDEKECGKCEAITLQACSQLSYNVTMLPNFLGHMTQSDITMSSEYVLLTNLIHTRCHSLLKELGCSLLAPPVPLVGAACPITRKNDRRRRLLPCRSLCEEVRDSCKPILESVTMSWPSFLDCGSFPQKLNNSDETCLESTSLHAGICSSDEFRCLNRDSDETQCVTMTSRCDGTPQCLDASDEEDCDCEKMKRFQCRSGERCIDQDWVCDSHKDCADASDEDECSNCTSLERSCSDYSCVALHQWCDGNDDCLDGSDEASCLMLVPRGRIHNARIAPQHHTEIAHTVGVLMGYHSMTSQWLPVCADDWDAILSHLSCNQMGFSDALSFQAITYYVLRHHILRHQPIKIMNNHRVRRVQATFSKNNEPCSSARFVHITCRPRTCGRRLNNGGILTKILGGRTSRENKWPWIVSLQLLSMNHVCGATLVRPQWLVSAAHCFQERKDVRIWKAKIPDAQYPFFNVTKIIIHPRYDSQAMDFDIALVRLDRPLRSSKVEPLCLPSTPFNPGSFCVIAGWGLTGRSMRGTKKLQEGIVHIIDRGTCQNYYPNHVITNRMVCSGHGGVIDACSGDSGGPLMCWQSQRSQWQLAGITSWGSSCTPHSAPGVYTDVKYFSDWVYTTMEQRDYG